MADFGDEKPMVEYEPADSEDEFIDQADGEGLADFDEDEEDEEGAGNAFVDDGFIVDDGVEDDLEDVNEEGLEDDSDEDGVSVSKKKKKKKKRSAIDDEVEEEDLEDDLQLLSEQGINTHRHKRLRKAGADDMQQGYGHMQHEDQIRHQLGLEEDEDGMMDLEDDVQMDAQQDMGQGEEEFLDNEQDDFIVYDNEGQMQNRAGMDDEGEVAAQRELQEIFGDYNQFLDYYKETQRIRKEQMELGQELDTEMPDFDNEEDMQEWRIRQQEEKMQERRFKDIDPETAKRLFITPRDQDIRMMDIPERYMQNQDMHLEDDEKMKLEPDDCLFAARWIYEQVFRDDAPLRLPKQLVEEGRLEVDNVEPYKYQHLEGVDLQIEEGDMNGFRCLLKARKAGRKFEGEDGERYIQDYYADKEAQDMLQNCIVGVLENIYCHFQEVAYIGMYAKETCGPLLAMREADCPQVTSQREFEERQGDKNRQMFPMGAIQSHHRRARRFEVLDAILHWSYKYQNLLNRKKILEDKYRQCLNYASDTERQVLEDSIELLGEVETTEAVDDIQNKVQLMAVDAISTYDDAQTSKKRPLKMRGMASYKIFRDLGIPQLKEQIVLSASDLGNILEQGVQTEAQTLTDEGLTGLEDLLMSIDLNSQIQRNSEDRKKSIIEMAALEIAYEPKIRQFMRSQYLMFGVVTTKPTEAGKKILNAFHPLGITKRLESKPVLKFQNDDQWLKVQQAEKQQLITVTIEVQEQQFNSKILTPFRDAYLSDSTSQISEEYNALREAVLQQALGKYLVPMCVNYLKATLESEAKEAALYKIGDKIWQYAIQPPVRIKRYEETEQYTDDDLEEYVEHLRIMACCWGQGRNFGPPTTFAVLDPYGQLIDYMQCPQFSGRIQRPRKLAPDLEYSIFDDEMKKEDAEKLRSMIQNHAPHLIVIGATGMDCRQLDMDIRQLVDYFLEHHSNFLKEKLHETQTIDVQFMDQSLAQLWEDSWAAREEFKEYDPIIRRTVALGRLALDPLAVVSGLCGVGKEILKLRLHPQQSTLADQEVMRVIENTLVSATSQVGVDINRAAQLQWTGTPLQFVPGLGPRKAKALIEYIQRSNKKCIESRQEGLRGLDFIHNRVFRNCAPYIRVTAGGIHQLMDEGSFEALDNTRIHPDSYEQALAICNQGGFSDRTAAFENNKDAVEKLDLPSYKASSDEVEETLSELVDIQFEIIQPYYDLRRLEMQNEKSLFYLLAGESEETFKEGRLVRARVLFIDNDRERVKCLVEGNIEAWLARQNISSKSFNHIEDRIQKQQQLDARILDIDYKLFQLKITTSSIDLGNFQYWEQKYCAEADEYFRVVDEEEKEKERQNQADDPELKVKAKKIVDRVITHPKFKNVSMSQAVEFLKDKEIGDCIFRPHVKSTNYISLSVKVFNGHAGPQTYHYDFKEGPKGTGPSAHLKLGLPLRIHQLKEHTNLEEITFEDLDEVLARFVEPLVEVVKKFTCHRRFRDLDQEGLDAFVREERQNNPQQAAYAVGFFPDKRPGVVLVSFMMGSSKVHHDYMLIQPSGIYYRKRIHKSLDHALAVFKKEPFKKQQPQQNSYGSIGGGSAGGGMSMDRGYGMQIQTVGGYREF